MDKLLDERIVEQIREAFAQLKEPVQILLFGSKENCQHCEEARQLLQEVVAIDSKLGLDVYDLQEHASKAQEFYVDKTPAIVIAAKNGEVVENLGIQFSGVPSGMEFSTFINDILLVSGRDSGLAEQTRTFLRGLEKPIHLQIFVTPT